MEHIATSRQICSRRAFLEGVAASALAVPIVEWPLVAHAAPDGSADQQLRSWDLFHTDWDRGGPKTGIPVFSIGRGGWLTAPLIDAALGLDSVTVEAVLNDDLDGRDALRQVADGDLGSIAVGSSGPGRAISPSQAFLESFRARFAAQPGAAGKSRQCRVAIVTSIMSDQPTWLATTAMAEVCRRVGLETVVFLVRPARDDFEDGTAWAEYLSYRYALESASRQVFEADVNEVLAVVGRGDPDEIEIGNSCDYLAVVVNRFEA